MRFGRARLDMWSVSSNSGNAFQAFKVHVSSKACVGAWWVVFFGLLLHTCITVVYKVLRDGMEVRMSSALQQSVCYEHWNHFKH